MARLGFIPPSLPRHSDYCRQSRSGTVFVKSRASNQGLGFFHFPFLRSAGGSVTSRPLGGVGRVSAHVSVICFRQDKMGVQTERQTGVPSSQNVLWSLTA